MAQFRPRMGAFEHTTSAAEMILTRSTPIATTHEEQLNTIKDCDRPTCLMGSNHASHTVEWLT